MGWGVGGAQQGWGERAEHAQLNVGKTPTRYLGPISSLRSGTHVSPPHQPPSGLGEICPKSKELTGQELEWVTMIITSWGQGAESEGGVGFSLRRNRNWFRAWEGLESCDHPLQECAPSSGATQVSLRGTGAWAWCEYPLTHTPSLPTPLLLPEFRWSVFALSMALTTQAPKMPVGRGPPCLHSPQIPLPLRGPWVPWDGEVGEGCKEESKSLPVGTSSLPDREGALCGQADLGVGTGKYRGPGVLRLRPHPGSVTDLLGILEQSPSWVFLSAEEK